ncbi:MAG: hypothetical protein HONBIEJF_00252 [Fimbriimonadaceae bacterium]|nr:hypothetical protein [Fimbriimonadaceae bacterium]
MTSLIVLLFMFVMLLFLLGAASYAAHSMRRSSRDRTEVQAFQVAQSVLEYQAALSYAQAKADYGIFKAASEDHSQVAGSISPGATGTAVVLPVTSDPTRAWVTSTATYAGKTRSLRTLLSTKDVSIWNNAIFAGTGASGQSINGNVDIRGSVHILGDGEPYSDLNGNGVWDDQESYTDANGNGVWDPGEKFIDENADGVWNSAEPYNDTNKNGYYDPPLTTTDLSSDMSGTAHIGNNYYNMPATLKGLVPPPPQVNGKESLSTEVRVKHGKVALSGSATIGETDPDGSSKGAVDGVFVNDGWGGNKGATNVTSDNGTDNAYDLGHLDVGFPIIDGIGAEEYVDKNGVTWPSLKNYYDNNALVVPITKITNKTDNFSYTDAKGNSITYTKKSGANPAKLVINGVVKINGNLLIDDLDELRYTGRGTIYTSGNLQVGNNLLPLAGKKFPTDTALGLVAGGNMGLATGPGDSQLSLAGAFYAMGTIQSAKQNQIAGTFVANFFDMGKNVPNIYQVPTLRYNMPPAMPGDEPIVTLRVRSWRTR